MKKYEIYLKKVYEVYAETEEDYRSGDMNVELIL